MDKNHQKPQDHHNSQDPIHSPDQVIMEKKSAKIKINKSQVRFSQGLVDKTTIENTINRDHSPAVNLEKKTSSNHMQPTSLDDNPWGASLSNSYDDSSFNQETVQKNKTLSQGDKSMFKSSNNGESFLKMN